MILEGIVMAKNGRPSSPSRATSESSSSEEPVLRRQPRPEWALPETPSVRKETTLIEVREAFWKEARDPGLLRIILGDIEHHLRDSRLPDVAYAYKKCVIDGKEYEVCDCHMEGEKEVCRVVATLV